MFAVSTLPSSILPSVTASDTTVSIIFVIASADLSLDADISAPTFIIMSVVIPVSFSVSKVADCVSTTS